jgi:ammonia channel protein AmtB
MFSRISCAIISCRVFSLFIWLLSAPSWSRGGVCVLLISWRRRNRSAGAAYSTMNGHLAGIAGITSSSCKMFLGLPPPGQTMLR